MLKLFNGFIVPHFAQPKLPLNQFYPYIHCALCCGFLIDATTITECLHTCECRYKPASHSM